MDEHVQWVDREPNHTQTIFGELTMHNLCMTYSVSMQVPQSCTATKLHITLLLMHTTTILHGPNDLTMMIQFPPEMDKNWVRYGLAKLGQIS